MNNQKNVNSENSEAQTNAMQNVIDILESVIYARRIIKAEVNLKLRLAQKQGAIN